MGASSSSSTSVHSMSKGSKLASSVLILRVNGGEEIEFELRLNPQRIAFDELMRAVERDLGKFCKAWLRRSSNIDFADARLALKNAQNKAFHRNSRYADSNMSVSFDATNSDYSEWGSVKHKIEKSKSSFKVSECWKVGRIMNGLPINGDGIIITGDEALAKYSTDLLYKVYALESVNISKSKSTKAKKAHNKKSEMTELRRPPPQNNHNTNMIKSDDNYPYQSGCVSYDRELKVYRALLHITIKRELITV